MFSGIRGRRWVAAAFSVVLFHASASTGLAQRGGIGGAYPLAPKLYTLEDTVHAVRRMFNERDGVGTRQLARGMGGLTGVGVGACLPISFGQPQVKQGIIGASLVTSLAASGFGLLRIIRFSRKHRDQVVAAYLQGEPLPHYVRRRLRTKHFRTN